MIESYRRWFEYEKDAHEKTLASLRSVPDSKRGEAAFQKAVELFAHIIAARRLWLYRMGVADEGPADIFPQGVALGDLDGRAEQMQRAWSDYLERLDDGGLARVFEYRSFEGERYRNSVGDILTQLFGHSWYHRGQIASLVRGLDCEPAVTDFVFRTRELIPE